MISQKKDIIFIIIFVLFCLFMYKYTHKLLYLFIFIVIFYYVYSYCKNNNNCKNINNNYCKNINNCKKSTFHNPYMNYLLYDDPLLQACDENHNVIKTNFMKNIYKDINDLNDVNTGYKYFYTQPNTLITNNLLSNLKEKYSLDNEKTCKKDNHNCNKNTNIAYHNIHVI